MKVSIAVFVLLTLSVYAFGQKSSFETAYEQKTIFQYGNKYMLNGQRLKSKALAVHLREFEASGFEFKQYNKHATRAAYLTIAMIGSYVAALTQLDKNNNLALGLAITGFTANLIAIPISSKAQKHLQKSVWLYNKDILR